MGESIRSNAAPNLLIAAGASTLEGARLVGGVFAQLSEELLVAELDAASANATALAAAEASVKTAETTLDLLGRRADLLIASCHDELWNGLGRPAHDRALAIAFPMATKTCSARNALRPARMMAVAAVLSGQVHSRLPRERCAEMADAIRALAKELRAANDAAADAEALRLQCAEVRAALGKVVHARLAALKRMLKAHGFSEVDIHRVIPVQRRKSAQVSAAAPRSAEDLAGSASSETEAAAAAPGESDAAANPGEAATDSAAPDDGADPDDGTSTDPASAA